MTKKKKGVMAKLSDGGKKVSNVAEKSYVAKKDFLTTGYDSGKKAVRNIKDTGKRY